MESVYVAKGVEVPAIYVYIEPVTARFPELSYTRNTGDGDNWVVVMFFLSFYLGAVMLGIITFLSGAFIILMLIFFFIALFPLSLIAVGGLSIVYLAVLWVIQFILFVRRHG